MNFNGLLDPSETNNPLVLDTKALGFDEIRNDVYALAEDSFENEDYLILPEHTPVSNQNGPDCVANACCDAVEIMLGLEDRSKVVQLSRRFAFYIGRQWMNPLEIGGTFISYMLAQFQNIGVVPESMWDYSHEPNEAPDVWLYKTAYMNRIKGCFELKHSASFVKDLVATLRARHVLVVSLQVGKEFREHRLITDVSSFIKEPTDDDTGGHAVVITGYRKVANRYQFLIRNSWGIYWGQVDLPGHAWLDQDYLVSNYRGQTFVVTNTLAAIKDRLP